MGMKYLFTAASPPELLFNLFAAAASAASLVLSSAYFHQRGTLSVPTEKILDKRLFSPERLAGLELGAYLSIASVFQIYGLGLTTVGHSAFIIQLATVFAPLLQAAMYRLVPSFASIASTLVAFCGVLLLTTSSGSAATASTIRAGVLGDILSLIAALIYGLHVVPYGPRKHEGAVQTLHITGILLGCSLSTDGGEPAITGSECHVLIPTRHSIEWLAGFPRGRSLAR